MHDAWRGGGVVIDVIGVLVLVLWWRLARVRIHEDAYVRDNNSRARFGQGQADACKAGISLGSIS